MLIKSMIQNVFLSFSFYFNNFLKECLAQHPFVVQLDRIGDQPWMVWERWTVPSCMMGHIFHTTTQTPGACFAPHPALTQLPDTGGTGFVVAIWRYAPGKFLMWKSYIQAHGVIMSVCPAHAQMPRAEFYQGKNVRMAAGAARMRSEELR